MVSQSEKKVAIVTLNDDSASLFERLIQTLDQGRPAADPSPHGPENVDTYRGTPCFQSEEKVLSIGQEALSAKTFIIATGAIPFIPPIQGLDETPFKTPLSLFKEPKMPASALVLSASRNM